MHGLGTATASPELESQSNLTCKSATLSLSLKKYVIHVHYQNLTVQLPFIHSLGEAQPIHPLTLAVFLISPFIHLVYFFQPLLTLSPTLSTFLLVLFSFFPFSSMNLSKQTFAKWKTNVSFWAAFKLVKWCWTATCCCITCHLCLQVEEANYMTGDFCSFQVSGLVFVNIQWSWRWPICPLCSILDFFFLFYHLGLVDILRR